MSDEALRALARAVERAPGDLALGLQYANQLERSGARQAAFVELARLSRLGLVAARERVRAWNPCSSLSSGQGAARRSPRSGLLRPPNVIFRSVEIRRAPGGLAWLGVLAATDRHAILTDGSLLAVLSFDPLELAWTRRNFGDGPPMWQGAALFGDELVVAGAREDALVRCSAATGEELGRAPLSHGYAGRAFLSDDRVVISQQLVEPDRLLLVGASLGAAFGTALWEAPTIAQPLGAVLARDQVVCPYDALPAHHVWVQSALQARRVEDGHLLWDHALDAPGQPPSTHDILAADDRGLVLARAIRPEVIAPLATSSSARTHVYELDLDDRAIRWTVGGFSADSAALDDGTAFVVGRDPGDYRGSDVLAIDRRSGRVRWRISAGGGVLAIALTTDALYVAGIPEPHIGRAQVAARRLADGSVIFEADIPVTPRATPGVRTCEIVVLDGRLVVLAGLGDAVTAAILE